MNRLLHFTFIILLLVGCQGTEENSNRVFFAGEIVNPTDRQVVLYRGEKAIDSIELDENNLAGRMLSKPAREHIDATLDEQLIVEYYSAR